VFNGTHYVSFRLDQFADQPVFADKLVMRELTSERIAVPDVVWHPWKPQPRPAACTTANADQANLWISWAGDGNVVYCYAAADVRLGTHLTALDIDMSSNTFWTIIDSPAGRQTIIDGSYNPSISHNLLPFTYDLTLGWGDAGVNVDWVESGAFQPQPFKSSDRYPHSVTATPGPKRETEYVAVFQDESGRSVSLNLFKVKSMSASVVVGPWDSDGTVYERDYFVFHPIYPEEAPGGYRVLDGDGAKANIWRCLDGDSGKLCHSVGQAQYGIDWDRFSRNVGFGRRDTGVDAHYNGGYGNWSASVRFICQGDYPADLFELRDVAGVVSGNHILLSSWSRMVCPGYPISFRQLEGGSVFLIIVVTAIVFVCGLRVFLRFVIDGSIRVPRAEFWGSIADSLTTALVFIGSCGRQAPSYEPLDPLSHKD
jgi:hypothetical protein